MGPIPVIGFDPSLNNWGMAAGTYCLETDEIIINKLAVTAPLLPKGRQVRKNIKDLAAGTQLAEAAIKFVRGCELIFVELPSGSQSARAAVGYGVCIGVLGTLRSAGIPYITVTPTEVKLAAVGDKNATKIQMIDWAHTLHPNAPWPYHKRHGNQEITIGTAEHMADAIGAIYAGLRNASINHITSRK